ncbi:MAG: ATP-binding protein [Candidatus Anstonellales archaeon]
MEKESILRVLEEWNFWNRDISRYVGKEREHLRMIEKFIEEREIITLSGPRRSGKSTTMYQLMNKIARKEGMESILYVNFEDPVFLPYLSPKLLDAIYVAYKETVNPSKKTYMFLDEIQNIPGWEKWVRACYDKNENIKFIISGSSSKLLSSEFSSLLTGRFVNFEVFPLSFKEFLGFKDMALPKKILKNDEIKMRYFLNEYFEFGGFPEVVLKKDKEVKRAILSQYFDSMIMKDVVERYKIRDVLSMKQVAVFGMTNISREFSFNTLRKTLKISLDAARDYMNYLEQAYILFQIPYFSYSIRESMVRNRKLYSVDVGIRNIVSRSFTPDKGWIAENIVYSHLRRNKKEIYYWRGKGEVDFVVKDTTLLPINVTYAEKSPEREEAAILEFFDRFKAKEGIIVSDSEEREKNVGKGLIRYIPLWKFLLTY